MALEPGMVVYVCNPSYSVAKTGESSIRGKPGQEDLTRPSQKRKGKEKEKAALSEKYIILCN